MAQGCAFGLLLVCFVVSSHSAAVIPPPRWSPLSHNVALDANVFLYWMPNGNEITFEIQVPTKGWIGFGFGTGHGMTKGDIVVGWVKGGKGTLQDMHAEGNGEPTIDDRQDWKLLNAEETDAFTALRFSRLLDTRDCSNDQAITADTMHIIWAYHESDQFQYHGKNMGEMSLHLLDSSQPQQPIQMPPDVLTFDLIVPNVTVPPNKSTFYWCHILQIPKVAVKHHIIKYSRLLDKAPIVHHIIAFGCFQPISTSSLYNTGYECYTPLVLPEFNNCRETTLGWDTGGDEFVNLPPEAGIPIGTRDDIQFFLLEMHYNNVEKKAWTDQSGFRIWYTPALRKYDSGTLTTGAISSDKQIIPPKSIFTTHGICSEECTRKFITGAEGLRVFAYSFHSHLLGRQMRARHVRNGVQIGWLGKDEHYDFNYQQIRQFSQEKRIFPGDTVIVECFYNSSEREVNTYGGPDATDEMCLAYYFYYPRIKMSGCQTVVSPQNQVSIFNASVIIDDNMVVLNPANYRGQYYKSIFDKALWNDHLVRGLQEVQTSQPHTLRCEFAKNATINYEYHTIKYPSFNALSIQEASCSSSASGLQSVIESTDFSAKTKPLSTSPLSAATMARSFWIPIVAASMLPLSLASSL